jgi:hypothetical protein
MQAHMFRNNHRARRKIALIWRIDTCYWQEYEHVSMYCDVPLANCLYNNSNRLLNLKLSMWLIKTLDIKAYVEVYA